MREKRLMGEGVVESRNVEERLRRLDHVLHITE